MSAIRLDLSVNGTAALFGLGYIIGLRYAAVIAAGSVFAYLVLTPLIFHFGSQIPHFAYAGNTLRHRDRWTPKPSSTRSSNRSASAPSPSPAIIGIIRMGKIVAGSISLGFKGLKGGGVEAAPRTQTDMSPRNVLLIQFGSTLLMAMLFFVVGMTSHDADRRDFTAGQSAWYAVVGAVVGFVLSFLFTPVAAQAIAIVGVNPVSGMTLITVVLTILALVATHLKGTGGMFIALIVGCAVCTALSTSGRSSRISRSAIGSAPRLATRSAGNSSASSWRLSS